MKKFLSFSLAIIMILPLLFSCKNGTGPVPATGSSTTGESTKVDPEDGLIDGAVYRIVTTALDRNEYVIKGNGYCLPDNMECTISAYKGVLSSLWRVRFTEDNTSITLESIATCERYITVPKDSKTGDPITVSSPLDPTHPGQIFIPVKSENGCYILKEKKSSDVISLKSASAGSSIITAEEDGSPTQLWKFIKTADPEKQIPSLLPLSGGIAHSSTPEVIRDGDTYYMYVMTGGVSIKKSLDLRNWEYIGDAFSKTDKPFPFSWMSQEVPGYGLWCPGIYEMNGKYYLYYALSTGGSQYSAICLAVNETLDYTSKKYRWVDKGVVLHSHYGDDFNAIDPQLFIDQDGISWLVYGSYWSGIQMRRIDPETGHLDENHPEVHYLASIEGIEAPYIVYREGYYYLFCATNIGEYDNRVGRSENVTGPYVDKKGRPMLDGYSELVTANTETIKTCAHNSFFKDYDGQWYMIGEYTPPEVGSPFTAIISTVVWTEDGWPTTALTPNLFN